MRIPHGLADSNADLAYVAGPGRRIVALDLARGEVLARSDFEATPVAADGELLIGWTAGGGRPPAVRIIAARRHGNEIRAAWQAPIELPDWVDPESAESGAFSLDAEIDAGVVVVTWTAHARYGGGAPPPPDVEAAATHDERGIVRLDRETGAPAGPEERMAIEEEPAGPPPAAVADRRVVPYRAGPEWATAPWHSGAAESSLVRPKEGPGVALLRRQAGRTDETRLSDDPDAEAAVTPDGGMIFVHDPGAGGRGWHAFSAATGERLASLPFDPGTEWVAVVGDRVLYHVVEEDKAVRRRSLRCRSLPTGERLWSQTLEEVATRAPPPPMR